jgi:hypothetical protein
MKAKLLGLMAIAAWLSMSPARATTYDYAVDYNIGSGAVVTGSIETDCINCYLASTDFVSWNFSFNGIAGSSSGVDGITTNATSLASPLYATPAAILFVNNSSELLTLQFCNGTPAVCDTPYFDDNNFIAQFIGYILPAENVGPLTVPVPYQIASLATPLPAALPLFGGGLGVMGLLARRRKRKNTTAIAA